MSYIVKPLQYQINGENREASKFTKSQFENRAKSIDTAYNVSHKQSLGFKSPPV